MTMLDGLKKITELPNPPPYEVLIQGWQLAIPGIPPPAPPEAYLVAQLKEAHTILSRLSVSFDRQLPSSVYLAMSYLHVEIAARGGWRKA